MPTLPSVSASKEFLDALFDKHNIDGDQVSSKACVDKQLRQTLGSPQNEQLVEAVSHAIISHVREHCPHPASRPLGSPWAVLAPLSDPWPTPHWLLGLLISA